MSKAGNTMYMQSDSVTRSIATRALAKRLAQVITDAVDQRDHATIIVSGGSTPKELFRQLSKLHLPWQHVTIIPSDERVVAADHPDRNERMIQQELLQDQAAAATLVSLVSKDATGDAEQFANQAMSKISMPIDIAVLGMGDDGHTASLFPDSPDIEMALSCEKACVLQQIERLSSLRLSLTPAVLLNSREINLLMFGDTKRAVLERALQPGAVAELPVRLALHQQKVPVTTYWAP